MGEVWIGGQQEGSGEGLSWRPPLFYDIRRADQKEGKPKIIFFKQLLDK